MMPPIGYDWRPDDRFDRPRPEGVEGMSAADEAWEEWNANPDHEWLADSTQHAAFMAGYRRALDACPKVEIESKYDSPTTCKVWRNGVLIFDAVDRSVLLRNRAAAVAPRETKD